MPTPDPRSGHSSSFGALGTLVARHRALVTLALLAVTVLAATRLPLLRVDSANENWFVRGDPSLARLNKFKAAFGNDDFVFVLYETDDVFRSENLRILRDLAEDLRGSVPYILDVTWIGSAESIEGREDTIDVHPLITEVPESADALEALRHKALSDPVFVDSLVSSDAKVAGILLEIEPYPPDDTDPRKAIAPAVREVLARPEYRDLPLHVVGGPILDYDLDVLTAREGGLFTLLCLLVEGLVLYQVARGARGVLVPLAIVSLSMVWTFAAIELLGFTLNVFAVLVPVLLICVSIGDSMHLIAEFHDRRDAGDSPTAALERAFAREGLPCTVTSLTTAAGFLSFVSTRIRPFQEMGVYTAAGVMIALALTFLIVPLAYGTERAANAPARPAGAWERLVGRLLHRVFVLTTSRSRTIIAAFAAISVLCIAGATLVRVESNTIEMFSRRMAIRRSYDVVDARMGGSMSVEILLDTGKPQGIADPDFQRRFAALEAYVKAHPMTTTTTSVLDILKKIRRAFHENRQEFYSLPESSDETLQYLLLYEMSGGTDKDKLVSFEYDVARLTARTRSLDTKEVRAFLGDVQAFADTHVVPAATVYQTGMLDWVRAMNDLIGEGQKRSFLVALLVIVVIIAMLLRSMRLGLIAMLPNVFPVIVCLGIMGFFGVYVDIAMMTFSAVILSVGDDDTIHSFSRFRREFADCGNYAVAIERTLSSVGRPIVFTTLTLTMGFAVLAASNMTGIRHFGVFAGIAFAWALLADLLLAPAILLVFKPLGPETPPASR